MRKMTVVPASGMLSTLTPYARPQKQVYALDHICQAVAFFQLFHLKDIIQEILDLGWHADPSVSDHKFQVFFRDHPAYKDLATAYLAQAVQNGILDDRLEEQLDGIAVINAVLDFHDALNIQLVDGAHDFDIVHDHRHFFADAGDNLPPAEDAFIKSNQASGYIQNLLAPIFFRDHADKRECVIEQVGINLLLEKFELHLVNRQLGAVFVLDQIVYPVDHIVEVDIQLPNLIPAPDRLLDGKVSFVHLVGFADQNIQAVSEKTGDQDGDGDA